MPQRVVSVVWERGWGASFSAVRCKAYCRPLSFRLPLPRLLSVFCRAAGNECAKAVDGIPSESGYYNSQGTGSSEFLQINLGAPVLLASLVFINRNPQVRGRARAGSHSCASERRR